MIRRKFHRPRAIACVAIVAIAAACAGAIRSAIADAPSRSVPSNKPTFLVATRELGDPLFQHSVVLMVPAHQPPLVVGIIINKPGRMTLRDVFPEVASLKDRTDSVYFGGPVDYTSASLLTREPPPSGKAQRVLDGVYLIVDRDSIAEALKKPAPESDLRFVLGRAQWSHDQLRSEIQAGSWYIAPAAAEQVFSAEPKGLWRELINHAELQKVRWDPAQNPFALLREPVSVPGSD